MAEVDDDVIPIGIPQVPGKPEAAGKIADAMNAVIAELEHMGDMAAPSIFFTIGLAMAQAAGVGAEEIRRLVDHELARSLGASPRPERQRHTPGRRRRLRCH